MFTNLQFRMNVCLHSVFFFLILMYNFYCYMIWTGYCSSGVNIFKLMLNLGYSCINKFKQGRDFTFSLGPRKMRVPYSDRCVRPSG